MGLVDRTRCLFCQVVLKALYVWVVFVVWSLWSWALSGSPDQSWQAMINSIFFLFYKSSNQWVKKKKGMQRETNYLFIIKLIMNPGSELQTAQGLYRYRVPFVYWQLHKVYWPWAPHGSLRCRRGTPPHSNRSQSLHLSGCWSSASSSTFYCGFHSAEALQQRGSVPIYINIR